MTVEERLTQVSERVAENNAGIRAVRATCEDLRRGQEQIHTVLVGDERQPGLRIRVDRLEQSEDRRRWHTRALWSAVLAAIVTIVTAAVATLTAIS